MTKSTGKLHYTDAPRPDGDYQRFAQKYILHHHFFTWDELRSLCISLGYSPHALKNVCSSALGKQFNPEGVEPDNLQVACKGVEFYDTFNYAFNQHTSEWNNEAIHTAIHLLHKKALTFDELFRIRNAYSFCESQDGKGLKISHQHLLDFFKLCNRVISPKKLMHRIKHMSSRLKVTGRIQLAEALNLALWCENYEQRDSDISQLSMTAEKNGFGVYKLSEFREVLQPRHVNLVQHLDDECIAQEWSYETAVFTKSRRLGDEVAVDEKPRLRDAAQTAATYAPILSVLRQSQEEVRRSHGRGYVERPGTVATFLRQRRERLLKERQEEQQRQTCLARRPTTVRGWIHFCEEEAHEKRRRRAMTAVAKLETTQLSPSEDSVENGFEDEVAESRSTCWNNQETSSRVFSDQTQHEAAVTEALFALETAEVVANKYVKEDLEYLRPGFWRRSAMRESTKCRDPPFSAVAISPSTPHRSLRKNPVPRERFPSPVHERHCDAKKPAEYVGYSTLSRSVVSQRSEKLKPHRDLESYREPRSSQQSAFFLSSPAVHLA